MKEIVCLSAMYQPSKNTYSFRRKSFDRPFTDARYKIVDLAETYIQCNCFNFIFPLVHSVDHWSTGLFYRKIKEKDMQLVFFK